MDINGIRKPSKGILRRKTLHKAKPAFYSYFAFYPFCLYYAKGGANTEKKAKKTRGITEIDARCGFGYGVFDIKQHKPCRIHSYGVTYIRAKNLPHGYLSLHKKELSKDL